MKIPVFVSCPTLLNPEQRTRKDLIDSMLLTLNLEPRALGTSDYPSDLPLREVLTIARHRAGGVVLGFNQFTAASGVRKPGATETPLLAGETKFPTEWNNLDAGVLFALRKPLLVFREEGISGGVFDPGVTDVFVHTMPDSDEDRGRLMEIFLKWRGRVAGNYHRLSDLTD